MKDIDSDVADRVDLPPDQFLSLVDADSLEVISQELVRYASQWMRVRRCALWWLDTKRNGFQLTSVAAKEPTPLDLDGAFLPYETADDLGLLSGEKPVEISAGHSPDLSGFDLNSCLSARIQYDDRTSGILIAFPDKLPHSWSDTARSVLRRIAQQGAVLCRNFERREKLVGWVQVLQEISETTSDRALYDLVLQEGRVLMGCDRAVVRRVNLQNGHLDYVRSSPRVLDGFSIEFGEGGTGLAFKERRTYRIGDVMASEWASTYRSLWSNLPPAHSELAVPILLPNSEVRIENRVKLVDKPFGVLNFESPTKAAFSSLDQYCAEIIAQRMAPVMERIEFDNKLDRLRRAEKSLAMKRDWDSIVDTLLNEIRHALGYEFVSISIVDLDARVIRCIRVVGILEADEFRKAAVYPLDSNHIQADCVRTKQTVVPSPNDPRLSHDFAERFGPDKLIRVFAPMTVASRNEVIGTICAGYDRTFRQHIYQRDIQLLQWLVAFGTYAMEARHRGTIDRVSHEMNAPLSAVRGNLSRLRRRRTGLSEQQIELVLEDMETDIQVLYHQVQQLEYVLGGAVSDVVRQPLRTEAVLLFRDIIFKTINQLKPLVRDGGLDPGKISCDRLSTMRVNVDKSKISQVIFNLFMNAVKYSESPETFQIHIGADETRQHYVIKFCDWGIGIPKGLEDKIFEERYRAPAAMEKGVMGSGLGLTISRQLMRAHGGDLIVKNRHKPTEFDLIIPKRIKESS